MFFVGCSLCCLLFKIRSHNITYSDLEVKPFCSCFLNFGIIDVCCTCGRKRLAFNYKKFCFSQRDSTPGLKLDGLQTIKIGFSRFDNSQVQHEGIAHPELCKNIFLCVISHTKGDEDTLGALT